MMWMELDCIMLSKISQSEKDKCHMIHSYVEFKKQNRLTSEKGEKEREENHKTFLTMENKLRVAGGEVDGGMGQMSVGYYGRYWVSYVSEESLNSPKTNIALYVSQLKLEFKEKGKKKKKG